MNTFTAVFGTILIQQNTSEQARLANEQSERMREFQNRALIAAGKATVASAQAVAKNMAAAPISIEAIEGVRAAALESRRIIEKAVEQAEADSVIRRERLRQLNAESIADVKALVAGKTASALPSLIQEERARRELTDGNN